VSVGVGDRPTAGAPRLRAEPNPSRGRVAFVANGVLTVEAHIEVLDLQGRLLRDLGSTASSAEPLAWDGKDERGSRVPPGVYLARVRWQDQVQNLRLVLLP
jgi:flagellar hook assembly protein FlgD